MADVGGGSITGSIHGELLDFDPPVWYSFRNNQRQKLLQAQQQQEAKRKRKNAEEDEEVRLRNQKRMEEEKVRIDKMRSEILTRCNELEKNPPPRYSMVEEGKTYNIVRLLSGTSRDYLVRRNKDQVKIHDLSGKYVLLYFMILNGRSQKLVFEEDLQETYSKYSPREFEVVFVAIGDNEAAFDATFSSMKWLAIPHKDKVARENIKNELGINLRPYGGSVAILFDPKGTALGKDTSFAFSSFGSQGFPFTRKCMDDILKRDKALWDELVLKTDESSLIAIFGEHVISPEGNKVPTSELGHKTVGVYFFDPGTVRQASKLLQAWNLLKPGIGKDFDIVFVNRGRFSMSEAMAEFEKQFECSLPWYRPTVDGRRLSRVFRNLEGRWEPGLGCVGNLIILKPDKYQSFSYFAYEILGEFGNDAYPFTMEIAVALASKQEEKLVLSNLLSPLDRLHRRFKEEKKTTAVSELSGKCVLLLFATHSCYTYVSFFDELEKIYLAKKRGAGEDDFEVVYISLDCTGTVYNFLESIKTMPWLAHSFDPNFGFELAQEVFKVHPVQLPAIAAFGPDGRLKTKESNLLYKTNWGAKYPFISDVTEEVHKELLHLYKWDFEHVFSSEVNDDW